MDTLIKDIRYGIRSLLKHPGFAVVAVATLALGIGANTAIFSLVNAVLLRPLTFPEPERLVMVWEDESALGFPRDDAAPANFVDWKTQNQVFEEMAALDPKNFNLTGDGEPERVMAFGVTGNLFSVLGVAPALGRTFTADDYANQRQVAVLNHGLWQRRYGSDSTIVGRDILLNGEKYTVVGVMPVGFQFMSAYGAIWVPGTLSPKELANRDNHYLTVVARMKRGVTLAQAHADIKNITARIAHDHPDEAEGLSSAVVSLHEQLSGKARQPLVLLLVAVGLVLLIGCANIASLLLARAAGRRKELALRAALGASRARLLRQLLTESVMLSGVGGGLGLLAALWSFKALSQFVPPGLRASTGLHLDLRVLAYTLGLSLFTGILFGLAPALQASKIHLNEALKQGSGRSGASGSSGRLRGAFIVAQVALALVLLVGAGLLIQTVFHLREQYSAFKPEQLLTVRTGLAEYKYREPLSRAAFYDQVLGRVQALPGVVAAGYTTSVPLQWKGGANGFTIEGRAPEPGVSYNAIHRQVSASYLQTMGIALRRGRFLDNSDTEQTRPVAIVNETLARQYWPGGDALEKRFKLGVPNAPWVTIVGVVADVRQMGMDQPVKAEMYFPYRQIKGHFWFAPRDLVIRTSANPASLAAAVRQEIRAVDPDQPVSNVATMEELLVEETGTRRSGMILLAMFAGFALLLASLGLYGVLSYTVGQQVPEIGVRMALGARPANILALVVRQGMRWTVLGIVLGLGAAFGLTRLMKSLLFEVSATDLTTFLFVPLVLLLVALLACFLPARRATKVDPLVALRYE